MNFGNLCGEEWLGLDQAGGRGDLKIPLGISFCIQGVLLKMLRVNGSDTGGQAGTWHLVALGWLAGLDWDFTREGINK